MRFLVLVTPVPDEASIIGADDAAAGLRWLKDKLATGSLESAEAYPHTGGYMIVDIMDRHALHEMLADYPLLSTINLDIRELVSLDEGFGVLLDDIAKRVTAPRVPWHH